MYIYKYVIHICQNNSEGNPSNSIFLALSEYLSKHKKGIKRPSKTVRKFYANK